MVVPSVEGAWVLPLLVCPIISFMNMLNTKGLKTSPCLAPIFVCQNVLLHCVCIWDMFTFIHYLLTAHCFRSPLFITFYTWLFQCWLIQRLSSNLTHHQYLRPFYPHPTLISVSAVLSLKMFSHLVLPFNECSLNAGSTLWPDSQSRNLPSKIFWSVFPKTDNDGCLLYFPGPFRL